MHKHLKFTGKKLFLCDMRPGFSEDGVEVSLPKGDYTVLLEPSPKGRLVGFSLLLVGKVPDSDVAKGKFSIDMARVGVFDRNAFTKLFGGDQEALSEWSEEASDHAKAKWGGFLKHKKGGLEALFVDIGSDCECAVRLLRSRSNTVGVRVVPQLPEERPICELGSRHWTEVEVKCQGIKEAWSFVDDRDFDPEFDQILDNVIFETSYIDEDSQTFLKSADIDPDTPISKHRKRFTGVTGFSVFVEHAGKRRQRISVPHTYKIPKIGVHATPREIANAVFEIFQNAKKWA